MKFNVIALPVLALGLGIPGMAQNVGSAGSPPPTKVGIIHIQNAIISTKDGQKAANELQTRFAPKKTDLDKKQNEVAQLRDQLGKGSNTMSEDAKQRLMRDIDQKTKSLNRDTEDAQAELDQEQGKIMQELGGRIVAIIDKYAKENGYSLVLDVSSPQTPVLYAANGIDITGDIIALYDKNAPAPAGASSSGAAGASSSAAAPGGQPAVSHPPAPAASKPAAPTGGVRQAPPVRRAPGAVK